MNENLGYLKLIVHSAHLRHSFSSEVRVEINLSNKSIADISNDKNIRKIRVSTDSIENTSTPHWDEDIELRCCLGWDLNIFIICEDIDGSISALPVDPLIVGNCTTGEYYCRWNSKVCGDIKLSIDFFPNHQSMKCLTEDSCKDKNLLLILINELNSLIFQNSAAQNSNMVNPNTHDDDDDKEEDRHDGHDGHGDHGGLEGGGGEKSHSISTARLNMWEQLHATISIAKYHIENTSEMEKAILVQHYVPTVQSSKAQQASNIAIHDKLERYQVAALVRSYLLALLGKLPKHIYPEPKVKLIEKQLSIYQDVTCAMSISTSSSSLSSSFTSTPQAHRSHSSSNTPVLWGDILRFLKIVTVWFIQQTYVFLSVLEDHSSDIGAEELSAIVKHFEKYDLNLSGEILASDLIYLLQDMGEVYTPLEIRVILNMVDCDHIGIVELPEFVKWWCAETPSLYDDDDDDGM